MTESLTHDRAAEEIEIVALGAATPDVTAGVLAHARECQECRKDLDELTVLLAALTVLMPESELNRGRSAGIRSRLMARADADAEAAAKRRVDAAARRKSASAATRVPTTMPGWERMARSQEDRPAADPAVRPTPRAVPQGVHPPPPPPGRSSPLLWAIMATVALLGSGAVALLLWPREEEPDHDLMTTQVVELEDRIDSLEAALAERERAVDMITGPGVRVVDLVSWASGGRPIARVFWDTGSNRWSLFVYELRPPRADHTYQLWALTAQGRMSAGTFLSAADGTARMETTLAVDPGSVRSVLITEEPVPGSRQPTGRALAAGTP